MASKTRTKGIVALTGALLAIAIATIGGFEGRRTTAYQDVVGVWTICDGITAGVKKGDTRTPAECDALLKATIERTEAALDKCLTVALPGKTKVAIVSWGYNVGTVAACGSTLVRLANAGKFEEACRQLPRWNKGGRPLREILGLTKRRLAEMAMCLDGLKSPAAVEPTAARSGWTWWLWPLAGFACVVAVALAYYRLRPKAVP